MALQKKELIAKLQEISELYSNTVLIRSEMDNFIPEDHYERKISVPPFPCQFPGEHKEQIQELWENKLDHTLEGIIGVAGNVHRDLFAPKEPAPPKLTSFVKPKNQELERSLSYVLS